MGKYRKVDVRLWGDKKFLALPDDARMLWLYLLTCNPNTIVPGVILNLAIEVIIADLRLPNPGKLKSAFALLKDSGMAFADWDRRLIWMPKGPEYNPVANPKQAIGWLRTMDDLPECALSDEIRKGIRKHIGSNPKTQEALKADPRRFRNRFANGIETVSDTVSKPEAETEAEAEADRIQPPPTKEEEERMKTQEFVSGVLARTLGVNRG